MRKSALIFLIFVISLVFIHPPKAQSGDLGALVRLDKLRTAQTTGGMICATPESAGTETSLQVIFPSGMTVNSTASNWTVTTSNLPSGASAMPGIATATSVSGQTVTFPISDLSVGTQYCFNFDSSSTLTTPSSTGNYEGTLRTRNGSNTVIDTRNFAIPIVSNNTISVTATAPAQPTDFEAALTLNEPSSEFIREDTEITYTITYGSLLANATQVTVQAEWDQGTIQGNNTASENVLTYVSGSATDAYNNTEPVIDTVNRTITWEITSFPANTTDRTVRFKLKTYDDYTGSLPISFDVKGRVLGPGTQTSDSTVTSSYKYSSFITPTLVPTCIPSRCPTPLPSSTPTPTPVPKATTISDIEVRTISSSEATIIVNSNNKTTARFFYGTAKNSLSQSLSFPIFSTSHLIKLDDLEPQTRYYFRIVLTDEYGRIVTSDMYVIDTAALSTPSLANISTLIVTSNDVILTDPLRNSDTTPKIVIPHNTTFSFKFAVNNYENVKSMKAVMRNNNVLGLFSDTSYASTQSLTITEISPGQYIGQLASNPNRGNYELILQISDFSGNISEQVASLFNIVDPLKVINSNTKIGIENAKITLYYFNERLKTYELLSSNLTPIKNPSRTEPDGTAQIVLPPGKYRAEVEALGHQARTVEFSISPQSNEGYPQIELNPLPFSLMTYLRYSASTAQDIASLLREYLHTLRTSIRFFDLMAFFAITLLVFLTLVATARRLSVPLGSLPYFLLYQLVRLIKRAPNDFLIHGNVIMANSDNVVPGALVYIALSSGRIITHTTTNALGEFMAHIKGENLKIIVSKKGFHSNTIPLKESSANDKQLLPIEPIRKPHGLRIETLLWYVGFVIGALFETILVVTLIIELLFVLEFGWLRVLPFITISLLNLALWAFHVRHTRSV